MKILHLEDSSPDAELFGALIRQEWPDCEIDVVGDGETFQARVASRRYDLILSDFNIPGFDGLVALGVAQQRAADTPFVFLSGTIGEDRAVEAMRTGAVDYILKDRPRRLIPAIRQALAHSQQIHDHRATEAQLLHAQRIENIGMLAAGIAHDFNNVLAPVLMGIPMLREHIADPGMNAVLSNMENSVQRGVGLVQQILGFAQNTGGRAQLVQSKHIIRELLAMVRQTFPKSIEIEESVERDLWLLEINPTHLHQLFLNLCVNARDAMPEGGKLFFGACNRQIDLATAATTPGLQPGRHVVFEVSDAGTGISASDLERIWEPFFTTKEAGRGTGLGLPTVRRIVSSVHGAVTIRSTPGRGTTFTVFLPAARSAQPPVDAPIETTAPRGRGELILVVDDDESVRSLIATILSRQGYRTLVAANGAEAVQLLTPASGALRLVITDLDMPGLAGPALMKVVRSLDSSVRILAMSGRPEGETTSPAPGALLHKPFTAENLLNAVHQQIAL